MTLFYNQLQSLSKIKMYTRLKVLVRPNAGTRFLIQNQLMMVFATLVADFLHLYISEDDNENLRSIEDCENCIVFQSERDEEQLYSVFLQNLIYFFSSSIVRYRTYLISEMTLLAVL